MADVVEGWGKVHHFTKVPSRLDLTLNILTGRSECTAAVFVLIVQCLLSTFCNAAFMGLVYAKIARPQVLPLSSQSGPN